MCAHKHTHKRYFIIDQQIARTFECFHTLFPFYATQIINPFPIQGSRPITTKG